MSTQVPHTAVNNNAGYQNGVSTYVQSAQGNGTPRGNTNYQQAIYQNDVVKNGNTGGHDYFRFKTPPPVIQPLVLDVPKKTIELFAAPTKEIMAQRSVMLNRIVGEDGRPTLESLMDPENFPFIEPAIVQSAPKDYGVVHLKNIPYNSSRAEIVAFLGRNSRILNDNEEPVHIIMDRVTSKTNDAYVEFVTLEDAINAVNRIKNNMLKGRCARLGERPVDIEVSSQSALMKDLFPIARGLRWNGSRPEFKQPNPKEPWDNFKTFVTAEEMCMLVKHVEVPNRVTHIIPSQSPFSRDCPERAYECLISTIKKMPWYTTECITIKQRHDIYEACAKLIENLKMNIHDGRSPERLNETLQKRLVQAAMLCPGFTVVQKDSIASLVNMPDMELRSFNMPRYPDLWTHQYTLGPKPGIPLDVLEYYIAIIREETTRAFATLSIREKQSLYSRGNNGYWGFFWREIAFPTGETFDELTLAEAAEMEWDTIDRIIRRAVDIAYGGTGSEYSPRKGKEPLQITDGSTNGNGLMLQGANGDGVSLHW
ncbi:uncharacterized protein BCR38DRAFT_510403 [Pseudomassariella vexata]|uniref:RRM domain-containing protein n=1 Tax=Pseudomassariella vexata TaxID=1141098 RepID=A0A1Y2E7F1_9PEZI|nr:uncharacterized protein BCR38DRAFT_510403 [Pseudomassariella vexata]ORY67469.1 hypothetical protein BCR38DRAFT_510403 [Pseudomassariella vexata]